MPTFYGVEYSTDSRWSDRKRLERFATLAKAQAWRDEIGVRGVGSSYSAENGHRNLRYVYAVSGKLPGARQLLDIVTRHRAPSEEAAKAIWVMHNGEKV